jgi:hypothetical protein
MSDSTSINENKKMPVGHLMAGVTKEIFEEVMHSNFVDVKKEFKRSSFGLNSKTGRVVYRFNTFHYFSMVSSDKEGIHTVVHINGDVRAVKDVFIRSGFKVELNDENSLEYIKNFIKNVSDILPMELKDFDRNQGDYEQSQRAARFTFELKVKTVLFVKSKDTVSERLNCSLSILSHDTGLVERIKFRLQESKFIYGKSVFPCENINMDFFKYKLKRIFLTYSKNIINEYGLLEGNKRPREISEEEYERIKTIVKMITI